MIKNKKLRSALGKTAMLALVYFAFGCGNRSGIRQETNDLMDLEATDTQQRPQTEIGSQPRASVQSFNETVMNVIRSMPKAGEYSLGGAKIPGVKAQDSQYPNYSVVTKTPSNCTTATYSVFLKAFSEIQSQQIVRLDRDHVTSLTPQSGMSDGIGSWGWWNANGPGTARLVFMLGIGVNFRDPKFEFAKPGDFMKIWWSGEVGKFERGHSVVFSGVKKDSSGRITQVCYWSSNQSTSGFGVVCRARSDLVNHLLTRITSPEKISAGLEKLRTLPGGQNKFIDKFLQEMLTRSSSHSEVDRMVGTRPSP